VSINDPALPPVLEADRLQLRVAMLPLVRRVIRIDAGKLDKPVIRVVLLPNNRSNLPGQRADSSSSEAPATKSGSPLSKYQIGDFEIKNAAVAFRDELANIELRLPAVDLNLGDHGFSDTKLEMKSQAPGEAVAAGQLIAIQSLLIKAAISRD